MDDSSILKRRQNGGGNGGDGGPAAAQGCEVTKAPNIQQLHADGSVSLVDGSHITGVDVVLFCTGFSYSFPFLEGTGLVSVQDNRVGPLYQHVFPPSVAPTLSFVGLTWKVRWLAPGGLAARKCISHCVDCCLLVLSSSGAMSQC